MQTRLANKDFGVDTPISARRSMNFDASTLHGHDFYELDIIIGGKVSSTLNGKPVVAQKGVVFFLTPEDFHEYLGDGEVDILNLQFFGDALSSSILQQITEKKSRVFNLEQSIFNTLEPIFSAIELNIKRGEGAMPICSRLLECILLTLSNNTSEENGVDRAIKDDMQQTLIYIQQHFKENPTLSEVASTIPMNERYFCQKFKDYTGKCYKEYLRERKLRYARRLVLATEMPLIKIAEESGYETQSHFNREFKSYFGISPTAMRKQSERKN